MAWTLATGVSLLGVATLAVGYLSDVGFEPHRTVAAILGLVVMALVVGLFTLVVAVRSVAERVTELRRAVARVRAGDFGARVVVDDAGEISDAVRDEFGAALSVGIGLNSGPVVAGNIGGAGRFEFSVIGDAVNIAARVESATRQTGDLVLLTGQTPALLDGEHGEFVARPGLNLKGKTTPVQVKAPPTPMGGSGRSQVPEA